MKAMILAAGFGTRLAPYTDTVPKPLVHHKGIPMIDHQINRLKDAGADEIIINAHHKAEQVEDYFRKKDFGIGINVIIENEILGTGGGIINASDFFCEEMFFVVVNSDVDTNMDIPKMIEYHNSKNPFATIAVQKRKTSRYLEFDDDMILKRRAVSDSLGKNLFAFNGIHVISNRIFSPTKKAEFSDIFDIYFDAIAGGEVIRGYDAGDCTFKDLGKIENIIA